MIWRGALSFRYVIDQREHHIMKPFYRARISLIALSAMLFSPYQLAYAQDDNVVIVTATKIEKSVQDLSLIHI